MPSPQEATSLATVLFKRCSYTNSLKKARQIHARIVTATPLILISPYLNNNLLSMYSRCGSLYDSQQVFDGMPQRTIVSYNALIAGYSRSPNNAHMAFNILAKLNHECFAPNGPTFTSLLQASCCLEDILLGSALHSQIVNFGFSSDTFVQTSLLGLYSSCSDIESSKKVFDHIVDKDAMAWNSIIVGYIKNDKIMEGLYFFGDMVKSGALPSQFTYSMVLNACSRLREHEIGKLTHGQVILTGTPADLPLQNALLNMYCSCRDTQMAFRVFSEIENPNLVSWNSMLAGFSANGNWEDSMEMFIKLCQMSFDKPDDYTFAIVISATRALSAYTYGRPLHAQVNKSGFERSVHVGSTLVSMYFNNGETESAEKLLTLMPEKDVVLWTEMITGYARTGDGENAIKCFHEMSQEHKIDGFALSIVLSACADLATHNQGKMIHSQAVKLGYDSEMSVCGSLIDMYAKTGNLQSAEYIISQIQNPDLKCWNSMLGGYCHHGISEEAFRIFDEILKRGLIPDKVTYLSMLAACNHSGLVNKGKFLWSFMKENGIMPGEKHFSCLIGLLSRAGLMEEAEEMIMESPQGEHNLELWRTLLSSCIDRRNVIIGSRVAERIKNMGEEDSGAYVLLTNLYMLTGRWGDVAKMRRKMRGLVSEKDHGLSWIELSSKTHVFSSGDQTHLKVDEMQDELLSLQRNLIKLEIDSI